MAETNAERARALAKRWTTPGLYDLAVEEFQAALDAACDAAVAGRFGHLERMVTEAKASLRAYHDEHKNEIHLGALAGHLVRLSRALEAMRAKRKVIG